MCHSRQQVAGLETSQYYYLLEGITFRQRVLPRMALCRVVPPCWRSLMDWFKLEDINVSLYFVTWNR